ncbi:nickel-dependent hydrogenase large subunit [Siccirubricoccus sp. KC 17139]|uniref:Nickel-dependent hydrogenase large subunit n=1 Tax=Siccirubricoccus soli TaxID=2899147 RepID=A0ABT1DC70_9PROT|nr:nickel-dependent hydrogenase large subunit [Siccirubricoccus soli]MCO6419177.1 nickel-dependent hydrogenase large subunit [Siccirubricoccus soli]MCP2685312.1 nickel-dependent hydrogenase large subunit [Siccirubricoccus soli]
MSAATITPFDILAGGAAQPCRPYPRALLSLPQWQALVAALSAAPEVALLGLWAESQTVHAALWDEAAGRLGLASLAVAEGRYPALSPVRPGAVRFERMIRDLWGLVAEGASDLRPWLDHGRWPVTAPQAARPAANALPPPQPEFLPVEGEGVHQIPVGPVHAGIIEPGHFRFHVQGETVVRLEERLGYLHKGVIGLMLDKPARTAARFAARLSGDSTVAHGWAFAMAVEAALEVAVPPRAVALRALMAELERIHNHLNDWGFVCNDAAFAWPHARCGALREGVLRACNAAFGHRLMMDRVIPGGVVLDLAPGGASAIGAALAAVRTELPVLVRVYESHASLQDRVVGTGCVAPALVARFAAGGHVGRAAGRGFDARTALPYAPYDRLRPAVTVLHSGDVDARVRIRIAELEDSLRLVETLLAELPPGELAVPLPQRAGEGVGMTEAFRGECLHHVALDDSGRIRAAFPRDASWLQWPLLEAAIEGNIVADFPLCNKSFNCSYSGVDL